MWGMTPERIWSRELIMNPKQPILIGDVSTMLRPGITPQDFDNQVEAMVASSFNTDARYIAARQLDTALNTTIRNIVTNENPNNLLIIFPGNGSNTVKQENPSVWNTVRTQYPTMSIKANRIFTENSPTNVVIDLTNNEERQIKEKQYTSVLVIDDVIAKGLTLNKIRETIQPITAPNAAFFAASWFLRSDANVQGYKKIASIYRYSAIEGYPAMNSLSTWLRGDEKSKAVLDAYTKRYIQYEYGFKKAITILKEMTTYEK